MYRIIYIVNLVMDSKTKTQIETAIAEIYNDNRDKLKYYKLLTNINRLKPRHFIKYIHKDSLVRLYHGGRVVSITPTKKRDDFIIVFESNNHFKFSLLWSKHYFFYKTMTNAEIEEEMSERAQL
jgi:hypothetical protein